jgi:diguanylate cyclase (GGDEF)-like protein
MIKGLLGVYRNFYYALSESQLDQLTGLPNRRTFDQAINKIYLAKPEGAEGRSPERRIDASSDSLGFWLGMADIDKFKRVNDTWGHLFGDEVLLLTAQLMQAHFREDDFLFRFGGEEFVIIVAASNKHQALTAFKRFRAAVEGKSIPQVGNITISIGVTEMQSSAFTASLLDHADKALYFAKENGRNQVHLYEALVAKELISDNDTVIGDIEMF